jgi:hypothetical protein
MTYRTRPEMTRRAAPDPSAEQGAKDHAAMMERLKELTGAKPIAQIDSHEANQSVKPITQTVQRPEGYVAELPTLQWLSPINHACGEKTQISEGGRYEILGRRTPEGFVFIAKCGLDTLGNSRISAQEARDMCQGHYLAMCSE